MQHLENFADDEIKCALFLKTLKEATSQQHLLLESNVLLSGLVSADITLHQYYCYLFLMKHIQLSYENEVLKVMAEQLPLWPYRKSSAVIAEDLARINYTPAGVAKPAIEKFYVDTDVPGYVLGFMYVMEGSRLGGKVIYKNIHRTLGFNENDGAKYVADYGFNTGNLWKKFIHQFAVHVVKNSLEDETVKGAGKAFASIYDFFQSNRHFYEI